LLAYNSQNKRRHAKRTAGKTKAEEARVEFHISSLYNNMGDNSGIPNANVNIGSSSTPYVSLFLFIEYVLQFCVVAID
jgi:hypothetical protein